MPEVRAKFRCDTVTETRFANGAQTDVNLVPVTSGAPENAIFGKYTPSGQIRMTINNPDAAAQFIPGQEYYVDFTKAVKPAE